MDESTRTYLFTPGEISFVFDVTLQARDFTNLSDKLRAVDDVRDILSYHAEALIEAVFSQYAARGREYRPVVPFEDNPVMVFPYPTLEKETPDFFLLILSRFQTEIADLTLLELVKELFTGREKDSRGRTPVDFHPPDDTFSSLISSLSLTAVTPNWLMCGAPDEPPGPPDMGGGGGPGTRPVPGSIPAQYQTAGLLEPNAPWNFHLSPLPVGASQPLSDAHTRIQAALNARAVDGVADNSIEVVILDTAPPAKAPVLFEPAMKKYDQNYPGLFKKIPARPKSIEEAFHDWHQSHPLLKSLVGKKLPGGQIDPPDITTNPSTLVSSRLRITYYEKYSMQATDNWQIGDYDEKRARKVDPAWDYPHFVMDHGLFIAGIIHTLAPAARIHLVEVLNAYGFCSFKAIVDGFDTALKEVGDQVKHLLVNMSLMYTFPWDAEGLEANIAYLEGIGNHMLAGILKLLLEDKDFAANQCAPLQQLCQIISGLVATIMRREEVIQSRGGMVIAAAGNDGKGGHHPPARFPAAFSDVLGVAALDHNDDLASYSNYADVPREVGVSIFGGDESSNSGWADPAQSMLGLYIGAFPDSQDPHTFEVTHPNTSGWGRWAGTSFATPVVTGIMAQLLISGQAAGIDEAQKIIQAAFSEPVGKQERVFVKQG